MRSSWDTSSGWELKVLIADLYAVTLKVDGILFRFGNKSGLHLPPANLDQSIGTLPQNLRLDVCVQLGALSSTSFRRFPTTASSGTTQFQRPGNRLGTTLKKPPLPLRRIQPEWPGGALPEKAMPSWVHVTLLDCNESVE
jgi:hypothetical protein